MSTSPTKRRANLMLMSVRSQVERALSDHRDGRSIRIRPPGLVSSGYMLVFVAILFAVIVIVLADDLPTSNLETLALLSLLHLPVGVFGWLMARRTWIDIEPEGVRVVNPLNTAFVPWAELQVVDESSSGLLRIQTNDWSIAGWAVQASNWEAQMSRPGRVARAIVLLQEEAATAAERQVSSQAVAEKRWLIPRRIIAGAAVSWTAAAAVLMLT
jgi:hypothetical protein